MHLASISNISYIECKELYISEVIDLIHMQTEKINYALQKIDNISPDFAIQAYKTNILQQGYIIAKTKN